MMIGGPLLVSVVPGVLVILVTWWFKKLNFSVFLRNVPSILTVITAIILFLVGFIKVRGFEGGAYAFLAFFLVIFAVVSFVIANIKPSNKQKR